MENANWLSSRREALTQMGGGFGGLVLATMLNDSSKSVMASGSAQHDLRVKPPRHAPKANAVIQLFMHGGPSQVDLLDPKPELSRFHGQAPPAEVADDENRTTTLLGSVFKFSKHGESGLEFSEVLSGIAQHADEIAVVRSMFTEHRNHEQAIWMAHTGLIVSGRPNIGAWAGYGLGSENQNLPAYVALPRSQGNACRWSPKLVERLVAACFPRHADPLRRDACAASATENRAQHRCRSRTARSSPNAERTSSHGAVPVNSTWTPESPALSSPPRCN